MSKFEEFYKAALSNGTICNGVASNSELNLWFDSRYNITKEEIACKQAAIYANKAIAYMEKLNGRD